MDEPKAELDLAHTTASAVEQLTAMRNRLVGSTMLDSMSGRQRVDEAIAKLTALASVSNFVERVLFAAAIERTHENSTPKGDDDRWYMAIEPILESVRSVARAQLDSPEVVAFLELLPDARLMAWGRRTGIRLPRMHQIFVQEMLDDPAVVRRWVGDLEVCILSHSSAGHRTNSNGVCVGRTHFLNIPVGLRFVAIQDPCLVVAVPLSGGPAWPIVIDAVQRTSSVSDPRFWQNMPAFHRFTADGVELERPAKSRSYECLPFAQIAWQPLANDWEIPRVPDVVTDLS